MGCESEYYIKLFKKVYILIKMLKISANHIAMMNNFCILYGFNSKHAG